jgi:hypothetical protein
MHLSALLLSRLQFAFTISFHIIFPAFASRLTAECRDRARVHFSLWVTAAARAMKIGRK